MWGMFTSSGAPQKPYYAFLAFRRLLDCRKRIVVTSTHDPGLTAVAALAEDGKTLRVLLSNTTRETRKIKLQWKGLPWPAASYEKRTVDAHSDLQVARNATVQRSDASLIEEIEGPSVNLLTLRAPQ